MTDYKDYKALTFWRAHRDKVWGAIFIACLLAASFIPNNAERTPIVLNGHVETLSASITPSAPYTPCPKTRRGKWLKYEVAHSARGGYHITCVYEGDQLMTRDEVRL